MEFRVFGHVTRDVSSIKIWYWGQGRSLCEDLWKARSGGIQAIGKRS